MIGPYADSSKMSYNTTSSCALQNCSGVLRQLGDVGIWLYHQGAGRIQHKKDLQAKLVILGGADILPEQRGYTCVEPWECLPRAVPKMTCSMPHTELCLSCCVAWSAIEYKWQLDSDKSLKERFDIKGIPK